MGRPKKKQRVSDFYKEKTKGIYAENYILWEVIFNKLPENLIIKIKQFEKFWRLKQKRIESKFPVAIIEQDKILNKELKVLVESICDYIGLSSKFYRQSVTQFILYRKHKPLPTNFLITSTKKSVKVEFFRKPKIDDWDMAKALVEYEFSYMPKISNIRIDPRQIKTLQRKLITLQAKTPVEALEELYDTDKLSDKELHQKLALARQDKIRANKLQKKVNPT